MRCTFQTRRAHRVWKVQQIGKAIEDNAIKEKKIFFSLSATTFNFILMKLPTLATLNKKLRQ